MIEGVKIFHSKCGLWVLMAPTMSFVLLVASLSAGQEVAPSNQTHAKGDGNSVQDDSSLTYQLRELQAKVVKLEAALMQNHQRSATAGQGMMKMGGMQGGVMASKEMGNRRMMPEMGSTQSGQGMASTGMDGTGSMPMMGGMSEAGMSGMGNMSGKMGSAGMAMMGQMQGMGQMQMPSALPGFPGASHIYHIGATNFFLDHPQHITLSPEQQTMLNRIKQQTLLGQATFDRWIEQAEQELWILTGADTPNAGEIESKVRETEKLRSDKRVTFIRAVGEAATVLTDEQRQSLVGMLPPDHAASAEPAVIDGSR